MTDNALAKRLTRIYEMLFEMAIGNLTFRLTTSDNTDRLEKIATALNKVAQQLQEEVGITEIESGLQDTVEVVKLSFILDLHLIVKGFNNQVSNHLAVNTELLLDKDIQSVLTAHSFGLLQGLLAQLLKEDSKTYASELIFISTKKTVLPSYCMLSRIQSSQKLILSCTVSNAHPNELEQHERSQDDTYGVIQKVYSYILDNLDKPLPSAKELSKMVGTNEFNLKDGFRQLFHTSIYRFYSDARLQRAFTMIQTTQLSLKAIAYLSGYQDYNNFSKNFKAKFNATPTEVRAKARIQ